MLNYLNPFMIRRGMRLKMKFWKKLALFVITIISIILACSRYYIVKSNFIHSIENSIKQNTNQHILEKYMLENEIVKKIQEGEEVTDEKIVEYLKSLYNFIENSSEIVALYSDDYKLIYSNNNTIDELDISLILDNDIDMYCFKELANKQYMLVSSNWSINNEITYIINAYDINSIYEEKDRQLRDILITDIIILLISITVISIFSIFLTKPIDSLNKITKKIALGDFKERVNIKSKDEIGDLARSFNIMADEVENKIDELNLQVKQKNDFINRFYT